MDTINIPNLMPHQLEPFNGDHFVENEFLKLKDQFNIKVAIELGTCLGGSTVFFGKNFDKTITTEIIKDWSDIAGERLIENKINDKVIRLIGDSRELLPALIKENDIKDDSIFFLDDHWYDNFPLIDELKIIADAGIQPVIVIHDFKVPFDTEMGYDSYQGTDIDLDMVLPYLKNIYGSDGFSYYFNSSGTSTEIKRGILYCHPIINK